jgi:tetratricopeptide (TPR) repeat protein
VVREEVLRLGGARGPRLYEQLVKAVDALDADHEKEALRLLRALRRALPQSATVREQMGVALYRSGRFAEAAEELEAYVALCGAVDQHPALMDCYRALRDYDRVQALWNELGQVAAAPEVIAEARIVLAGSLADRGRLREAIAMLSRRGGDVRNVREHHLRLWYALADLEERAGNLPGARSLFERISRTDPGFADVVERLVALG